MELRDYLNVIRVRRGIILIAAFIVAVVALSVTLIQPSVYEAQSKVLISEKDASAALLGSVYSDLSSQPERALLTQVQLVEVRPVAEAAIKRLGLSMSPAELLKRVEVSGVGQTNMIAITASAPDPQEAADIANAIADEYVSASKERKRAAIKGAADEVEDRLNEAKTEILELGRRVQSSGKSDDLAAELQIATSTYSTLADRLEQLRIQERLESGSGAVVQAAVPEDKRVAPDPLRNGVVGLAIGLVFGLAMAFLNEYLDNTLKSTDEAEKAYGASVLGTVPLDKVEKGKRRLVLIEAPGSSAAEAYRVLRTSLEFVNFEHDLKTLLITSAAPAEGKSTVASNLAVALAQAGKKVVLLSADFRRPTTDQFLKVGNESGLSDVLLGTTPLKSALQRPLEEQLLVLTAGKMPPNPSELLGSSKMEEVIRSLEEWADWVIVDAPPLLAVSDPAAVARWADGVLMVSKAGEATRDNAKKATELLQNVGGRIVGVVIWGLDESKGNHGYGLYAGGYYYYRSYYGLVDETASRQGDWSPEPSAARRVAEVTGKLLVWVLGLLVFLAIIAVLVYLLDQYFGWGLGALVSSALDW